MYTLIRTPNSQLPANPPKPPNLANLRYTFSGARDTRETAKRGETSYCAPLQRKDRVSRVFDEQMDPQQG